MSLHQPIELKCPKCEKVTKQTYWDSINVTNDPELKEKFFNHEINYFNCGNCEHRAFVHSDFLYHDMDNQFMVHLLAPEDKVEDAKKSLDQSLNDMKNTLKGVDKFQEDLVLITTIIS